MTTTLETGRHVTPERIRADAAMMEREGFELVYECPLPDLKLVGDLRRMGWMRSAAYYADSLGEHLRSTNDIPGQPGRFA